MLSQIADGLRQFAEGFVQRPAPVLSPLADCLHLCHQRKLAVKLQLLEGFTRTYQVAPNRTHPHMNTYPATGFVLIRVEGFEAEGATWQVPLAHVGRCQFEPGAPRPPESGSNCLLRAAQNRVHRVRVYLTCMRASKNGQLARPRQGSYGAAALVRL